MRQERSRSLIIELHTWLREQRARLSKLNDFDPQAWLADVLARLPDHPAKRVHELLPWNWHRQNVAAEAA